jgi:hypothetical protein
MSDGTRPLRVQSVRSIEANVLIKILNPRPRINTALNHALIGT